MPTVEQICEWKGLSAKGCNYFDSLKYKEIINPNHCNCKICDGKNKSCEHYHENKPENRMLVMTDKQWEEVLRDLDLIR